MGDDLTLIPATPELVEAELESAERLAEALGLRLPEDWPPEHHDDDVLRWVLDRLREPGQAGWWLHYLAQDGTLCGTGGLKGPPRDGEVELGYSVVPSFRRRGIATAAMRRLIAHARAHGASRAIAQTLPELEASIGVMRKLGMQPIEPREPGTVAYATELR